MVKSLQSITHVSICRRLAVLLEFQRLLDTSPILVLTTLPKFHLAFKTAPLYKAEIVRPLEPRDMLLDLRAWFSRTLYRLQRVRG